MKENTHPNYHKVTVTCGGCTIKTTIMSTYDKGDLNVEFCSKCHPAWTGERKVSKLGKIKRFEEKFGKFGTASASKK